MLFFVVLIGFSFSNIDKIEEDLNSNEKNNFFKLIEGNLNYLKNENLFAKISYKLENECLKNHENFMNTLTYKLIFEIIRNINNKNNPKKEINELINIIIRNMSKFSEHNIYNEVFNETILCIVGIYINYKDNDLNSINSGENIIPFMNNIILNMKFVCQENEEIYRKYINKFVIFTKNIKFFNNLKKNEQLKELFINIMDECITCLIIENDFSKISTFINCFTNDLFLEFLENNYSCKKVFLQLIDCYYQLLKENLHFNLTTYLNINVIERFLNKFFKNTSYCENTKDLDTLINIFNNIADIESYKYTKKIGSLSIYTIVFYTKYIVTIPEKNKEKNSKLIEIFEKNVNKFITLINVFEIDKKNYNYYYNSYSDINKYVYGSNINFENNKWYNLNLMNIIEDTLHKYIIKIVMFELEDIHFQVKKFQQNLPINNFFILGSKELEKNYLKNIISNKVIIRIKELNEKIKISKSSEYINLTTTDKNLLKFVFLFEMINMDEIENRNEVLKFLENYKYNISKSVNNYKEADFFIDLSFFIMNNAEKLDLDINLKNNFLENLNKLLSFETEIQKYIEKGDMEDFQKLSIVKFIYSIKKSNLKFLEPLEVLKQENFKVLMVDFINNFEELFFFLFYKAKNSSKFQNIVYRDFIEIFYIIINNEDNGLDFNWYWSETKIRKEIYEHLETKFTNFYD